MRDTCERCPLRAARRLAEGDGPHAEQARFYVALHPNGCPKWMDGQVEEGKWLHEADGPEGQTRIVRGCYYRIHFAQMAKLVTVSNRPAEEISHMRAEQNERLERIGSQVAIMDRATRQLLAGGFSNVAASIAATRQLQAAEDDGDNEV